MEEGKDRFRVKVLDLGKWGCWGGLGIRPGVSALVCLGVCLLKGGGPNHGGGWGLDRNVCSGGVLLSHTLPGAVPSALWVLASGFGMGPGVSPTL